MFKLRALLFALAVIAIGAVTLVSNSSTANAASTTITTAGEFLQLAAHWSDRICCKRGRSDWFTSRRECRRAGGYQVADRYCRRDVVQRVCCAKRGHDWWTTQRACWRAGGHIVSNRRCRWD
jgi:hypothetical protein